VVYRQHVFFFDIYAVNFIIGPYKLEDIENIIECKMNENIKDISENLEI
jgi:hypothetical protein